MIKVKKTMSEGKRQMFLLIFVILILVTASIVSYDAGLKNGYYYAKLDNCAEDEVLSVNEDFTEYVCVKDPSLEFYDELSGVEVSILDS